MRRSPSPSVPALLLLCALAASAPAAASAPQGAADPGPREVISETVDQVLEVLGDVSLQSEARRRRIEKIAYQCFDFVTMSKLVVARHWNRFDSGQQEELVEEFKSFLANTYGERIDRYNQEKVVVVGEREERRGDVTVQTRISGGDYDGAEIDYRMRRTDRGWQVIDVKVEGVSIVLNYRDQFKSILGRKGPEGLLETLRQKNAERALVHES
jgi:phospholipid transport system substrate-binding protein